MEQTLKFFDGDELSSTVWWNKYRFDTEQSPEDMFKRHSSEIAQKMFESIERIDRKNFGLLSEFGRKRFSKLIDKNYNGIYGHVQKFINFNNIVLGGSMQQGIGNHENYSSLSNCFVLGQPYDSYSGIGKKKDEIVQVMKRRGGAGLDLSTIRPKGASVHNQAKISTGPVLFAEGYSNATLEVAQDGRRGALMLSLDIKHPDSLEFIESKQDLSKITGANISTKVCDEFMEAVEKDGDFLLRFPVDSNVDRIIDDIDWMESLKYDELITLESMWSDCPQYIKRIKAKDYWKTIVRCAHKTAEPGILFVGNWKKGGFDYIYPQYRPVSTNPCSEIPMQPFDACRLVAYNLFMMVVDAFTINAEVDWKHVYECFYEQLVIGDLLIDLECDYIDRIINKINSGKDPEDLKESEIQIWVKIKDTATKGRRIGAGFSALGDMLAALNLPYYSPVFIEHLFKIKMMAELDATTDLAILFGAFDGFSADLEVLSPYNKNVVSKEFPTQYVKMLRYGRRNISLSTAAPNGTGALMTQTTSGIEPLFKPFYKRRKKCIESWERVDYIDKADGQKFTEFIVFHPKFKTYLQVRFDLTLDEINNLSPEEAEKYFKTSPYFGQRAEDLNPEQRVHIQSIVQKYTTHAISSTINLHKDCKPEEIDDIYMASWKAGLKGNTVYRDTSRGGVLVSVDDNTIEKIVKKKRPFSIPAKYHTLKCNGTRYSVMIGFIANAPYEIFVVSGLDNLPEVLDENESIDGSIVKDSKDWYNFVSDTFILKEISDMENGEKLLSLTISGLMSSKMPLEKIIKIIHKSKPFAGSFAFKLNKILNRYLPDGNISEKCPQCNNDMKRENGCVLCPHCGWTKC